jgi:hypothetical protein
MIRAAQGIAGASGSEEEEAEPQPERTLGRGEIREHQAAALQNLLEALATLEPPNQEQQKGDDEKGDSGQEPQQQQAGAEDEQEDTETSQDPGQLLQAVRDREAERHRRKHERNQSGYEPVDKDW